MKIHKIKLRLFICCFVLLAITSGACWADDSPAPDPGPVPDSKVLIFFIDSLRPDVLDEMVAEGKLPNIKRLFYDRGLRFENFFTIFPSLTVAAYGALLTGQFPDQTGLKAMSLFERYPTRKKSVLKRVFRVNEPFPRYFDLITDREKAPDLLKQNKAKTLYDYLGEKFHSTVVPVIPMLAPQAWPHLAANEVKRPHIIASEVRENIDDINGKYALRYMVPDRRGQVFMIWFNQLDTDQHYTPEGQFSPKVRDLLINTDKWIGKVHSAFVKESGGGEPYVILFSDHGAYGGEHGIYNQPYYIGRDFFYQILKMNVRGPDYTISHPGTDLESYAYVDTHGRGQARLFFPVADSLSGNWERPNTLYELTHYGLGPNRKSVNLIRELMAINLSERNDFPEKVDPRPVDLAFIKLAENLVYIIRKGGAEALLSIEKKDGKARFRYQPVQNVSQTETGELVYEETFTKDPFGYLTDPGFQAPDATAFMREYHTGQEWLQATYKTAYPDAVPAIARAYAWKPELAHLAGSQDPDIWLSATPGWSFQIADIKATDHGPLLRSAMRATLRISGPNIRTGIQSSPHRIVEVAPTVLQMAGYRKKSHCDTGPIKGIYEGA